MDKKNDDNIPKEINCYKIGKLLYSYGIYNVHIGTNSLTKEEVTIKIINKKNLNDNSNLLSSINNEIFFSKILSHNNILKLIDIYESSLYIFIIMENFKGEFLSSYMNKNKILEESEALKIFSKIISAMIYLHNMNICHLNINLDSILIDENDENKIKICDFKYGQYYYTKFKTLNNSVESNMFTCPEVSMSDGYIPELADVWSSGILLCYLLTGEYPINTDKEIDSNERYIIPNNISQDLQDLLKNILDIDIDKRYRFDDILNSKYFIDNNYSNEILEENKNNHVIEKMNLRKIYERYLKEKSNLEKKQTQNLLINLENIINQDNLFNNKKMNKTLEINEESKNDGIDDMKINNIKNKENNKNLMNKSNKINTFKNNEKNKNNHNQTVKKDIFIDNKYSKTKNKNELNKSNKPKKNKNFFNKTAIFENPESLLSQKEEIKKPKIDKKQNKKFLGQKISSSVENRKKYNNIIDEGHKGFKTEKEENKEKNSNKKEYRSSIIYENNNSNEPVFNFEEDGEDSENEELSINSSEKIEKGNISEIKNDSGDKKNNCKGSLNKSFDSKKKNVKKKDSIKANLNINKKDISNKKNENKNKNMNKYKTKIFNENANNSNESKNKKLLVNYHQKTEVNKFVKSDKKDNKVQKYIKNTTNIIINNINDINKNKNEANININSSNNKSNKKNNSKLTKDQKNEENDKIKNNYKLASNKSSDNVIKKPNKYNNYKNLVISIKPFKNKNINDFQSKTPTLKNEKEKEYTSKNIYNKSSENNNFSPNFGMKNTQNKSEETKVNNFQKGNYYTSNYFYQKQNIRPSIINDSSNIIDSDDEDEIQREERKFRERIKNIQMKNTLKAVKLEGEKVIIKKFTNRTKTPDNKSIFKKSNIFSKNYREKRLDRSFDDGKRMIENKSYVSKRNSTVTNSDIVEAKNKNDKSNNNYEVILENLKNLNTVFEQNEENDYHSYIRRKITQENIILKQQNKKENKTVTPIESDNDDSQNQSESESENENSNKNKSEKDEIDDNYDKENYNKELKKEDNLIKPKIIQKNIKANNNIISKEDSYSDNSSSYKNIRINYNKDSENLNNDNISIINNEYKKNNKNRPKMKKRINLQEYINSKSFSINNPKQDKKEIKLIPEDKNKNNLNKSKDYIKAKKNLKEKLISLSSDLSEETVNTFNGPVVDLKYISFRNYEQTVTVLINEFIKKGVVFQKVGYNSFKCTKGIRNFYVEIVKIPNDLFYYRFYKKK